MTAGRALERWLYQEVHGKRVPRKPPAKATSLKKGPARNWKYRRWIKTLPCAVCGSEGNVEPAHTGSDGGTAQKSSDYSCIPLCSDHHTAGPRSYHGLNGGRIEFERRHNLDIAGLVKRLNACWWNQWKIGVNE